MGRQVLSGSGIRRLVLNVMAHIGYLALLACVVVFIGSKAVLSLKGGGVELYTRSDFVHLDVGRVRRWGQ